MEFEYINDSSEYFRTGTNIEILDPLKDEVIFQQIEIKEYTMQGESTLSKESVIRLFGLTEEGNSVCCTVRGFYPYFYVRMPEINDCEKFCKYLNDHCKLNNEQTVLDVKVVDRFSIHGYNGNEKLKFLKITVALPAHIKAVKTLFPEGICFEQDIDFILRFMVDTGIDGCTWIKLSPKTWTFAKNQQQVSYCQIEAEIDLRQHKFISYKADDFWSKIAPLKILSLNIECAPSERDKFPDAKSDPIIQIVGVLFFLGENSPRLKKIFLFSGFFPLNGIEVKAFDNERDMLEDFCSFIRQTDPDIITGYNIENFDIPYIINRSDHLNISSLTNLGRLRNIPTSFKSGVFESKQLGRHLNTHINMDGRVIFDLHNVIQKEYQLRSYSLGAVCHHFLGKSKEELVGSIKSQLYRSSQATRKRLTMYSLNNALLVIDLLNHLMSIVNYIEMARVTGVSLQALLRRGQLLRVYSQLLRKAKKRDFLIQTYSDSNHDETYEGGCVLDAKCGFYVEPIALLDFASMYPNIMITYNLCHSTLLRPWTEQNLKLTCEDVFITPADFKFVKPHLRKGLLPEILEYLLAARKSVKLALKTEQNPIKRAILDGRQLAIKLTANAVYGFTGAQHGGKLPCLEVARSVTAFGRQMINQTKDKIESHYSFSNGYKNNAQVIYGDTDSVMINFGVKDIESSISLGKEAAKFISSLFSGPITLEFENVFCPYLLIGKKRYAGLKYTNYRNYDTIITRGIETVRRDSPLLVKKLLNDCLRLIFVENDVEFAIRQIHNILFDLYCNKIDIHDLIITKSISNVNAANSLYHLREFMKTSQSNYAVGGRISYVICASGRNIPFYKKLEDPIKVIENQIPIDCDYYVQKCIAKPLLQIFQPILGDQAEGVLFRGNHTLTRKTNSLKTSYSKGSILSYTVKSYTCLSCNTPLINTLKNTAVCIRCAPKRNDVYLRELNTLRTMEQKMWRTNVECQTCQGSFIQEILCSNRDCPVLYEKLKLKFDLQSQENCMSRFGPSNW